eukprot:530515-Rhodomonas_salina.1
MDHPVIKPSVQELSYLCLDPSLPNDDPDPSLSSGVPCDPLLSAATPCGTLPWYWRGEWYNASCETAQFGRGRVGFSGRTEVFSASNFKTEGGSNVLLVGSNFGWADYTPSAYLGSTFCTKTLWTSDSSLLGKVSRGVGKDAKAGLLWL